MEIFLNYLILASQFVVTLWIYKLLNTFLSKRTPKIYQALALSLLFTILILPILLINDIVNVFLSISLILLVSIICFKGHFIKKICVCLIVYTILFSVKILSIRIVNMFSIKNYILERFISTLIICFIIIILCKILSQVVYSFNEISSNKIWIVINLFTLTFLISVIYSLLVTNGNFSTESNIFSITLTTLYLFCILAMFYLIRLIASVERITATNKQLKYQLEGYLYVKKHQHTINQILHDTKNHLSVVNAHLHNKDISQAKIYLNTITIDLSNLHTTKFCENDVVNSIINFKLIKISTLEISYSFHIDLPNELFMSDYDLSALLTNTLDNSIEACEYISDKKLRQISIDTTVKKGFFIYKIENTKNNTIKKTYGNFLTNKKNSFFHGYGLHSVKYVVDKYNGEMNFEYEEDVFTLLIIIPTP